MDARAPTAKPELETLAMDEEYSAASTTIVFDHPIPLLRGPLKTGDGSYVLAFRNRDSLSNAYKASESKIIEQCEEGARIGCAVTASRKCQTPWWRNLIGGGLKLQDLKERERCEEREMEGCFVAAKEKCVGFAKEKCATSFRKARIADC